MNRALIRHGFILMLLGLLGGFLIPNMAIPRLGLSAHTIGILGGVLLIALGAVWAQFRLGTRQSALMYWSWLYANYINWLGCLIGAITGAGRMTPVVAAGQEGGEAAEWVVAAMLISVGIASLIAVGLSLWGLRGQGD